MRLINRYKEVDEFCNNILVENFKELFLKLSHILICVNRGRNSQFLNEHEEISALIETNYLFNFIIQAIEKTIIPATSITVSSNNNFTALKFTLKLFV